MYKIQLCTMRKKKPKFVWYIIYDGYIYAYDFYDFVKNDKMYTCVEH